MAIPEHPRPDALLYAGFAMIAAGLLFKAAAVPFHVWIPDVYQGAPTPVTALMAACTKVAAFGALLRVVHVAFYPAVRWNLAPVLGVVAVVTMLAGAILAVTQTDIKRLLAYSSIANAGYLLVGTLALTPDGRSSALFYLVAYGFTVLAAFAVVTLVRDADGEATHLSRWAGLGRRSPLYAGLFTIVLLAFAGLPLTSGFTAKFGVFAAAVGDGQVWLVIAGVLASAVLAFPYLRLVVLMWLSEPAGSTPTGSDSRGRGLGRRPTGPSASVPVRAARDVGTTCMFWSRTDRATGVPSAGRGCSSLAVSCRPSPSNRRPGRATSPCSSSVRSTVSPSSGMGCSVRTVWCRHGPSCRCADSRCPGRGRFGRSSAACRRGQSPTGRLATAGMGCFARTVWCKHGRSSRCPGSDPPCQ